MFLLRRVLPYCAAAVLGWRALMAKLRSLFLSLRHEKLLVAPRLSNGGLWIHKNRPRIKGYSSVIGIATEQRFLQLADCGATLTSAITHTSARDQRPLSSCSGDAARQGPAVPGHGDIRTQCQPLKSGAINLRGHKQGHRRQTARCRPRLPH